MADDVLSQLLAFKWRTVIVPVSEFTTDILQDHVEHKWPDRDGAHVEATGRAPLVITAKCIFRNGVIAGKSEQFNVVLYPEGFRQFFQACSIRETGTLQHPELGNIKCKLKSIRFRWHAGGRDGCDADAQWVESFDSDDQFQDVIARPSPVASVYIESADLDTQVMQYSNPALPPQSSFLADIQAATAVFDTASLASKQIGGKIDHIVYRVQALEDAVSALRDNSAWPIIQSCERLKESLFELRKQQLVTQRTVGFYIVPKDQTLAALAAYLQTSIDDMMKLNIPLLDAPVVPRLTPVRYYE
jgi:prophage DNA circulation protein